MRGRIGAFSLQHIRPIDPSGLDRDQYFAGARLGYRPLDGLQHLGAAGLGRVDRDHHLRDGAHPLHPSSYPQLLRRRC